MKVEAQKVWMKLGAFFSFFYELVKDRKGGLINYCYRHNVLRHLIDLITRYSSNQQYGFVTNPPFDNAVKAICILARSSPLICYLNKFN